MVGQHIRAQKDGRWIHAIDCGDETVLHLVEDSSTARVRRAYKPEFVAGSACVEVVTHRERTFPAKEIVRRAYSRASDPALASMFRSSEAFAAWCATGRVPGGSAAAELVDLSPAPAAARPAATARKAAPARKAGKPAARKAPARKAKPAPRRAAKPRPKAKTARPEGARGAKRKTAAKRGAKRGSRR